VDTRRHTNKLFYNPSKKFQNFSRRKGRRSPAKSLETDHFCNFAAMIGFKAFVTMCDKKSPTIGDRPVLCGVVSVKVQVTKCDGQAGILHADTCDVAPINVGHSESLVTMAHVYRSSIAASQVSAY
jgi:hypothetical protein